MVSQTISPQHPMLKIGLLECGHVQAEFRSSLGGDYRDVFPAYFERAGAVDWKFEFYDACNGQFPENIHDCDAYICTGSPSSVYDEPMWISGLKLFVQRLWEAQKTFVGVCFGHQILAEALGGSVHKSSNGWCVGVHEMDVLVQKNWMQPSQSQYNLLMMCQDQVQVLPPEAVHLARTEQCEIAMFQVGQTMLGIQAHPEFTRAYNEVLMHDRVARMGEQTVENGLKSLSKSTHEITIGQWIIRFIESQNQPKS